MTPPDRPGASPLVGRTVGNYRIVSLIGRGGMGEVYRAHDEKLNRTVAVKALPEAFVEDAQARARFVRETRLAGRVNHPFVASVYDVVEEAGSLYLVMEHIEGRTLGQVIREEKPSQKDVTRYGLEIAEALQAIHGIGLVHRDLKPSNVLVEHSGHVKVTDFGVARKVAPPAGNDSTMATETADEPLTSSAEGVGTVIYMSPEQVRGEHVDHRSDLFSLGTVLYQAVTGEHPFLRNSVLETASAILHEAPGGGEEPKTFTDSGPVRQVVLRLLQKDPDQRYQETSSVVADLRAVSQGERLVSRPPVDPRKRRRLANGALAAMVVAVLATAALLAWQTWGPGGGVGSEERQLIAVLPFLDRTGEYEGAPRGEMLADLLAADLGESRRLRSMRSERITEILLPLGGQATRGEQLAQVAAASPAVWIVSGDLWKEGDSYRTSVDLTRAGETEAHSSFQTAAGGTAGLVDLATVKILETLFAGEPGSAGEDPESQELASSSEEARLLAYQGEEAARAFRYAEAIELLERALQLDPRYLAARHTLADTLFAAGYGRRAREEAGQALRQVEGPLGAPTDRLDLEVRSTHARLHEDLDRAVAYGRELVDRYPDEAGPRLGLATLLQQRDAKDEESLALIDEAGQLDPLDPRVPLQRSHVLRQLGRLDESRAALNRARALFEEMGGGPGLHEVEWSLGLVDYADGDFETALERFVAVAEGYRRFGLEAMAARAEKAAGDAELSRGRLEAAELRYRPALETARAAGQYRDLVGALNSLGAKLLQSGRSEEAERLLREARDQARALDNPSLLMGPTLNLASLLNLSGRVGEGRALAAEGLELARERGHRAGEIQALSRLADADFQLGRLDEAAESYRELIALQRAAAGSATSLAYRLASLAEVLEVRGSTESALAAIDEAIELYRREDSRFFLGYALLVRARVHGQIGLWESASADLDEAREITRSEESSFEDLIPRIDLDRGRVVGLKGDWAAADRLLAGIRGRVAESTANDFVVPALVASCETALELGRHDQALGWCRQALGHERARACDRAWARAATALALERGGDDVAAGRESRQALEQAETLGMTWVAARAAAVLSGLPESSSDREAVRERGRRALEAYLGAAPADRREAMVARPDLAEAAERLGWTGSPVSVTGTGPQDEKEDS